MATDKYDLHTIDYSVQGWDAIMTTDMEKIDDVVHTNILGVAGETMTKYNAVYLESDGKYDKALADGVQQPVIGLVLVSAVLNDEIRIQRVGSITNSGWAWLSVKKKVYLDPSTPGALTDVRPDSNAQMVGIVLSSTSIFIWVDPMEGAYDVDLRFTSSTELTIAAGVVTRSQTWHTIDTQDDDLSDDLDTINGGVDGCILIVRAENAARTVVLKDSIGNLLLGGADITLSDIDLMVPFIYDGTLSKWVILSGAAGPGLDNIVEDLTPQLGGDLDMNGHNIGGNSEAALDDAVAKKHLQNTDIGTSGNDFSVGDGGAGNKTVTANNEDVDKPNLRYNDTSNKWEFSNNGVDWNEMGTGGIANVVEDTTPELGGQLVVHEFGVKLDSLLSADGKYSGLTCDGVLGATLVYGDLVYLNSADDRWEYTDADAEATAGNVQLAIVLVGGDDGDTRLLLLQGYIREDDWDFTDSGKPVFVGLVPGKMVQDISGYTTGDIGRVVGHASTIPDQIYFNPSGTWIEI